MLYTVLIGLGSNLHLPINQINQAIESISIHTAVTLLQRSSLYQSLPQGPQDQDLFVNAAIIINTMLEPQELLIALQDIEKKQGKVKVRHWGERCIDLDILFINQLSLDLREPDLVVPHPHALSRDFVLIPSIEIAPDWILPDGRLLKDQLQHCIKHDLKKLPSHDKP